MTPFSYSRLFPRAISSKFLRKSQDYFPERRIKMLRLERENSDPERGRSSFYLQRCSACVMGAKLFLVCRPQQLPTPLSCYNRRPWLIEESRGCTQLPGPNLRFPLGEVFTFSLWTAEMKEDCQFDVFIVHFGDYKYCLCYGLLTGKIFFFLLLLFIAGSCLRFCDQLVL